MHTGINFNKIPMFGLPELKEAEETEESKKKQEETEEVEEEAVVEFKGNGENYYDNINDIEKALNELDLVKNSEKVDNSEVQEKKTTLEKLQSKEIIKKAAENKDADEELTQKAIEATMSSLNGASLKDTIAINAKVAEFIKDYVADEDSRSESYQASLNFEKDDIDSARRKKESAFGNNNNIYGKFAQSHVSAVSAELNIMKNIMNDDENKKQLDIEY